MKSATKTEAPLLDLEANETGDVVPPETPEGKRHQVAVRSHDPKNVAVTDGSPRALIEQAIAAGAFEIVDKMMDYEERWDKRQARKAFDEAIAQAKAEIPVISKNRRVKFDSKKPGSSSTDYKHEDMAEIARTVDPVLGKYGLSYRYRTTSNLNEPITVTCILSHRLGHSEENTLSGGRDDSGNKNSLQQVGSTITYLQRYTLKAALGLAAGNDDDGRASSPAPSEIDAASEPVITPTQAATLLQEIDACGVGAQKFCQHYGISVYTLLPADRYDEAIAACKDFAKKKVKA